MKFAVQSTAEDLRQEWERNRKILGDQTPAMLEILLIGYPAMLACFFRSKFTNQWSFTNFT